MQFTTFILASIALISSASAVSQPYGSNGDLYGRDIYDETDLYGRDYDELDLYLRDLDLYEDNRFQRREAEAAQTVAQLKACIAAKCDGPQAHGLRRCNQTYSGERQTQQRHACYDQIKAEYENCKRACRSDPDYRT